MKEIANLVAVGIKHGPRLNFQFPTPSFSQQPPQNTVNSIYLPKNCDWRSLSRKHQQIYSLYPQKVILVKMGCSRELPQSNYDHYAGTIRQARKDEPRSDESQLVSPSRARWAVVLKEARDKLERVTGEVSAHQPLPIVQCKSDSPPYSIIN